MGQKKVLVSIIVPTLNEAKFLDGTLNYVAKELKDFSYELIISDGGSKDETLAIAKKHWAKITLKKEGNKSIAEARNLGAKLAQGEYFLFMDADVQIQHLHQFLEKSLQFFAKGKVSAITVKADIYPQEKRWVDVVGFALLNFLIMVGNLLGLGAAIGEVQLVEKKSFSRVGGYDENLITSEDVDLFKRLSRLKKTLYLREFTAYFTRRRLNKEGWRRVLGRFFINFLWYSLFNKSYIKKWPEVR